MQALDEHFRAVRDTLVAKAQEHRHRNPNVKGKLRELLISGFLQESISPAWSIAEGAEIIHKDSLATDKKNQFDIVIYNSRYPGVFPSSGGGEMIFLESVASFIEVKSTLKKSHLMKFAAATKRVKERVTTPRQRLSPSGILQTPRPYSFVVAFDGPKRIETLVKWIQEVADCEDYGLDALAATEPEDRFFFPHRFIDGVFVLNRGYVYTDALPFQSVLADQPDLSRDHVFVFGPTREMLLLWLIICDVNIRLYWNALELTDYVSEVVFQRRAERLRAPVAEGPGRREQ